MNDDELARGARRARVPRGRLRPPLRASARATTSTSTASRRGPTCSAPLGERIAAAVARARARRDAARRAGARRRRARGRRLARVRASVPHRPQGGEGVRHRESPRGPFEEGETRVPRRGRRHLRRRAARVGRRAARGRSRRPTAVCVVDREEGGADALARQAVRLRPLFRAGELLAGAKSPAKPHG